jgi:hypothetical protein
MECWISVRTTPKQEVVDVVRETWMCESGKDEYVRASAGPETAYCRGTEFSRMGGYNFPGQIAGSDGSEGNGSMGAGFIVLKNPKTTGSIRVVRTEEDTDSTRSEMTVLLKVLIGTNVNENFNQLLMRHFKYFSSIFFVVSGQWSSREKSSSELTDTLGRESDVVMEMFVRQSLIMVGNVKNLINLFLSFIPICSVKQIFLTT